MGTKGFSIKALKSFNQKYCNELHEIETLDREKVWEKNGLDVSYLIWIQP